MKEAACFTGSCGWWARVQVLKVLMYRLGIVQIKSNKVD